MFGTLLIDASGLVFQFRIMSINFVRIALQQEWTNIPQAFIDTLVNPMRRCVALRDARGGPVKFMVSTPTIFKLLPNI